MPLQLLRWAHSPHVRVLLALLGLASSRRVCAADFVGSDLLASDSTLSLAQIERVALARNPSLAAMREAWREAGAREKQAGALEDPMLDGALAPQSLGNRSVDPTYRLGITQQIPLFGQRGLRRRAARAESQTAAYDFESARLDLLRDVRGAYFDYYRVCRSQDTNRELVLLMNESRRVALAKYSSGTVGQTDPLQAETELAMLEHQGVVLVQRRRMVLARMRALLHLPQSTPMAEPPRDLPALAAPDSAEWRGALPRSPELSGADTDVQARRADLTLAHREGLPGLGLGVAYDRFMSEAPLRTTVGVSLNLPLNLGRLAARRHEAEAALAKAEAERLAERDRIEQRIEEASASLGLYLHDVEIMRGAVVPASERSLKATRAAYEANRSDFTTLLNATRDLANARLALYEAQVMSYAARAELQRALAVDAISPSGEDRR